MKKSIAIHWFRQDLRLADNPSLVLAAEHEQVLPIYILDDDNADSYAMGGASRWWLQHSLESLNRSLGGALSIYAGNPEDILNNLLSRFDVEAVYWNRCYEPWRTKRDAAIKAQLQEKGVTVKSANASLLWEPWQITKKDGSHYKVFTPVLP